MRRRVGSGTYVVRTEAEAGLYFGLLIPGLGKTEIFEPICGELARAAHQAGHTIAWGSSTAQADKAVDAESASEICQRYIDNGVGGVFFAPLEHVANSSEINRQIAEHFEHAGIPLVLLDRDYCPYPGRSHFDLVGVDNRRIGYMVTHHLFQRGCQRVAFLARPNSAATIDARIAGFMEAVVKDAGQFSNDLVVRCNPKSENDIRQMVERLRPDGIVCGNDVTAGQLMHSLDDQGIRVPSDIRVAGIDDVKYAELLRVPLTSMRQPCVALGDAALQVMLDRLEIPDAPARDVLLGCELIARESTQ